MSTKKSGISIKIGINVDLSQKRCSGILVIPLVTLLCQTFYQMLNGMFFYERLRLILTKQDITLRMNYIKLQSTSLRIGIAKLSKISRIYMNMSAVFLLKQQLIQVVW